MPKIIINRNPSELDVVFEGEPLLDLDGNDGVRGLMRDVKESAGASGVSVNFIHRDGKVTMRMQVTGLDDNAERWLLPADTAQRVAAFMGRSGRAAEVLEDRLEDLRAGEALDREEKRRGRPF